MEVSTMVRRGDEGTCVNEDAKTSWSELEPGICDMILEKLPCIERLRLRVVCKDWNRGDLKRVVRKPYFVTILRSEMHDFQYLNGIVVYDVVSKSLSFEPLPPFKRHLTKIGFYIAPFAVQGLIFTRIQPEDYDCLVRTKQWCVYNIHTRTKHLLPEAPGSGSTLMRYFCGMMVDTSIKPYTFKLVVSYSTGEETQIYDSATRSWSSHPKPNPNSNSSLLLSYRFDYWHFCMYHKGCMYVSTMQQRDVLVYSMEEDQWSILSGPSYQSARRQIYMGTWDDRIFAVQQGYESVTVWELIDATQQRWVEYARCSKAQYEHLIPYVDLVDYYTCEIVSVFSEEYVMMYNWHKGRSNALVLLNLKTRE